LLAYLFVLMYLKSLITLLIIFFVQKCQIGPPLFFKSQFVFYFLKIDAVTPRLLY